MAHETREEPWVAGRLLLFDDSFEHEVWSEPEEAAAVRVVLLVDVPHPGLGVHVVGTHRVGAGRLLGDTDLVPVAQATTTNAAAT